MPKGKKDLEIVWTCPLGSECEEIKDNKIHRCMWYTKVVGMDANTGDMVDSWSCAISWMPTLQVEMSQTNRSQSAALESFRNETVKGQDEFNKLVGQKVLPKVTK
tara:strand:- start:1436 stop:1750 length:315 start_codon:yes stop_codon:yes gene_type:complete